MSAAGEPIGCAQAVERLWSMLDGDIAEVDRAALDQHLTWCLRCCGELAFAEHLRTMLRQRSQVTMPAGVQRRLGELIDDLCGPAGEVT